MTGLAIVERGFAEATTSFGDSCPLQCFNQGKCDFHNITNEYYCNCPLTRSGGFQGVHCETPFLECSDGGRRGWRCLNGGQCKTGDTIEACHCPDEFTGTRCEKFIGPSGADFIVDHGIVGDRNKFSGGAIFVLAMASVVLAAACFLSGFLAGRRTMASMEYDSNYDDKSEVSDSQSEVLDSQSEVAVSQPDDMNLQQDDDPPELPKDSKII